jgi:hypothetical protein
VSILDRLTKRLRERTSRPQADIEIEAPRGVTLSKGLRKRIQQRVNGYGKRWDPIPVLVKSEGRLFYFRSDWAKKEKARRRAANKTARLSRRANR